VSRASWWWPSQSCIGAEAAFLPSCAGWRTDAALPGPLWPFTYHEGAGGQTHRRGGALMMHASWHCTIEMLSSLPAAPPRAQAMSESHAALGVPRVSQAPKASRAELPSWLCFGLLG
jgi:hypothetical protein